jgi:hypothetical protein
VSIVLRILAVSAAGALFACGEPSAPSPSVGSNSNWLRLCKSDAECGEQLACRCGFCTRECSADAACNMLSDARCVLSDDPAAVSSCTDKTPAPVAGICLPRCDPGSCNDGHACVEGACVATKLPDGAFCNPVAMTSDEQRTLSDQLLALLYARRADGFTCGSNPLSGAAPAFRLDPRLICVARVLAQDLDAGAAPPGIVDALGRDTLERFDLVGYDATQWNESFAVRARSPEDALRLMLNDLASCRRLADASFRDVGVANYGDAYVVTIGVAR